jgi:hypothetical protein
MCLEGYDYLLKKEFKNLPMVEWYYNTNNHKTNESCNRMT